MAPEALRCMWRLTATVDPDPPPPLAAEAKLPASASLSQPQPASASLSQPQPASASLGQPRPASANEQVRPGWPVTGAVFPTQVVLQRGHGKAVDFWALGCMLLELLHGKSPFAAPHAHASYQLTLQVGRGCGTRVGRNV